MSPSMELIEHPLSPYSQKVRIALDEKGLAYRLSTPPAIGSGQTPEDFRRANPRGDFLLLNDRDETRPVEPGDRVKVVRFASR